MAQVLGQHGMRGAGDPAEAAVLIVNTCGFLEAAREESLAALRELVSQRRAGQMVIAAGCLAQRHGASLVQDVPGLDGVIGTRRWMDIFELVATAARAQASAAALPSADGCGNRRPGRARRAARQRAGRQRPG